MTTFIPPARRPLPTAVVRKAVQAHSDNKPAVVRELVRWYQERVQDASSTPVCRKWVKPLQIIVNTLNLV